MRSSTETRLLRTFADVLTAVLATAAGAVVVSTAACGGSSGSEIPGSSGSSGSSGQPPTAGFTSLCGSDAPGTLIATIQASPALDGIANRTETAFPRLTSEYAPGQTSPDPEAVGDAWTGGTADTVGTLCAKATDQTACLAKVNGYRVLPPDRDACVAQYPAASYGTATCSAQYIIYTRGDEIGVARTPAEIKALIGTFDTVGEALWAARNAGYTPTCNSNTNGSDSRPIPDGEYRKTGDGGWEMRLATDQCGMEMFSVNVIVDYAGNLTVTSKVSLGQGNGCPVAGRRPAGLVDQEAHVPKGRSGSRPTARTASDSPIGEHFAAMATLEAASVTAFRRLQRQLAAHGAPRELQDRVRKAARDEIRHARATGSLAKKFGVTPKAPQIAPCEETPSLFAIALENAREGCVRETYGALVAHVQAERSGDADVRRVMLSIADEETAHAALSWDIATWIDGQLGDAERAELAFERRKAFVTLARDLAAPVDPRVQQVSGVPASGDALRMLYGLAPTMLAA